MRRALLTNRVGVSAFESDLNLANNSATAVTTASTALRIVRANNVVVLSWPTNATGLHLESRTNLAA